MIIYGWNSKSIKQAELDAYQCANCGEKQSVLAIFAHYAHIFWIPLFPFKKSATIVCGHCQLSTEEKTMPEEMGPTIKQLKSAVGIPKSLFSGLILIVVAVAFFSFRGIQSQQLEQSYLENPQVGDVYVLKDAEESSEYDHFLMKISDIQGDSIWVSVNAYGYNGVVDKLDPEDGFYNFEYAIRQSSLEEFQQSGKLKKVIRDYSSSSGFERVLEYIEPDSLEPDSLEPGSLETE